MISPTGKNLGAVRKPLRTRPWLWTWIWFFFLMSTQGQGGGLRGESESAGVVK